MAQYAVPISDGDVSDWNCSTGTDRYRLIDDGVLPIDVDYIWRSSGAGIPVNTNDFQITNLTPLASTGWQLYIRTRIESAGTVPLNVTLISGGATVTGQSFSVTSTSFANFTYDLTPSECAAVTDWSDTHLIIESHGGGGVNIRVSSVYLKIPDSTNDTHNRMRMGVGK